MRDVIGVCVMFLAVGCALSPGARNLQPFVAATGQYALMAAPDAGPSPAPKPAGRCGTCGAPVPPGGGTLGDGTVKVPCPECNIKAALIQAATKPKACEKCGGDGIYEKDGKRWKCNQCNTAP